MSEEIVEAYYELSARHGQERTDVAVRSSATAEDLPDASFAGQQETYLNVRGPAGLMDAVRNCFASLFTDRAISYRSTFHFDHFEVGLSVCVQKMVRSDLGVSGVAFSLGYSDGQKIPGKEMLAAVARITRSVDVPVTADLEGGYAPVAGRCGTGGTGRPREGQVEEVRPRAGSPPRRARARRTSPRAARTPPT